MAFSERAKWHPCESESKLEIQEERRRRSEGSEACRRVGRPEERPLVNWRFKKNEDIVHQSARHKQRIADESLPAALDLIRQAFKSVGSRAQTSGEEVLKALPVLMSHARAGSSKNGFRPCRHPH